MRKGSLSATAGPSHRAVEIGVALAIAAFAGIVIYGSVQAGIGWAFDGPRAGFFPFYIGLLILVASIVNLINAWLDNKSKRLFAEWGQLGRVLSVVIPAAIYVALIPSLGMYVCSVLLIAVFMKWLGKYNWGATAAVAIGMPVVTFIVFEKWFLVPLPKGPVENLLGY